MERDYHRKVTLGRGTLSWDAHRVVQTVLLLDSTLNLGSASRLVDLPKKQDCLFTENNKLACQLALVLKICFTLSGKYPSLAFAYWFFFLFFCTQVLELNFGAF